MSGASAEPRNHDVAHEPDTIGGLEQSRRFVVETQELADPQPGTATADVTQEPLAAEFGGEVLVKGPAALVEPTDHAPHRPRLCIKHLHRATLTGDANRFDSGRIDSLADLPDRRERGPYDFLDVLLDALLADVVQ